MPLTKAEIRDRAGNMLGLLRLGQGLQYQDAQRIEQAYDEVHAELKKDGLAVWPTTGSVPDELVQWVVSLVADNCLEDYSVSDARTQRIIRKSDRAKDEIEKTVYPDYISQTDPTDF